MTDQTPRTATGRKVVAIYGGEMVDNVRGIEAEAAAQARAEGLDVEVLEEAMASSDGVKWPRSWVRNDAHQFSWIARQVAARYRAILAGETE